MRIFGFSLFSFSREVSLICFENVSKQKSKQFKELVIGISFRKKRQILAFLPRFWLDLISDDKNPQTLNKAQFDKNKQT